MRGQPPPLLPILRSASQAELLWAILSDPTRERSLTELAEQVAISIPTVAREVERAARAGLVQVRKVGRTNLVSANFESEYSEPLRRLLLIAVGPRRVIAEALDGIPGIEEAYLFGSWADRYSGNEGELPRDIDLLIIGSPNRSAVYTAIEPLETELGRPIQVVFRSVEQWSHLREPFVATVRSRPLVPLLAKSKT